MPNDENISRRKISLAAAFAFAAGIPILSSGIIAWALLPLIFDPLTFSQLSTNRNSLEQERDLIRKYALVIPITGIASGITILFSASLICLKPQNNGIWGIVIIIFSLIAIIGMGGFVLGTVLGLIGGILALIKAT